MLTDRNHQRDSLFKTLCDRNQSRIQDQVNPQGVKLKNLESSKDEMMNVLYHKVYNSQTSRANTKHLQSDGTFTDMNIFKNPFQENMIKGTSIGANNTIINSRDRLKSQEASGSNRRAQSVIKLVDNGFLTQRQNIQSQQSSVRKSKQNIFHSTKSNTSPHLINSGQNLPDLNEIFQCHKDAKLTHFLMQKHKSQCNEDFKDTLKAKKEIVLIPTSRDVSYRQDFQSMQQIIKKNAINKEKFSKPTDMKHLESIIQFTQPNNLSTTGGKVCNKKECLNQYIATTERQEQDMKQHKSQVIEEQDNDENNEKNTFEEKCQSFMRNLHKYYDKYIKNENAFMQKSYLESNMFSNKRRTIENIIKDQQSQKQKPTKLKVIEETHQDENQTIQEDPLPTQLKRDKNYADMIEKLVNQEDSSDQNENEKENPYSYLFGEYDFRFYNSKVPPPQKQPLGNPQGRREAVLLDQWFEGVMEEYVYQQKDFLQQEDQRKKVFYYSKVILTICIRDLVRQVSVHCVERGSFMEKILNMYISIYEAELRTNLHDMDSQKERHLESIKHIREQNQQQIHSYEKLIDSLNVKIKEVTQYNSRLETQTDNLQEQLAKMQEQLNKQPHLHRNHGGHRVGVFSSSGGERNQSKQSALTKEQPNDQRVTKNKKSKQLLLSDPDSDNGDAENYLKIKKKKVANLMEQEVQSPLLMKKGDILQKKKQKILIAESSDSVGTESYHSSEGEKISNIKISNSSVSSKSDSNKASSLGSNQEGGSKRKSKPKSRQSPKRQLKYPQVIISEFDLKLSSPKQKVSKQSEKSKKSKHLQQTPDEFDKVQLDEKQTDQIKEEITLILNQKEEDPTMQQEKLFQDDAQGDQQVQINNDDRNFDDQQNYLPLLSVQKQKEQIEDVSNELDDIESGQRANMIQEISDITERLYKNNEQPISISQKDLLRMIVETVLKNHKQTLLKLMRKVNEVQSVQENDQDESLSLVGMLKENMTTSNFVQLTRQRTNQIQQVKKIMKEGQVVQFEAQMQTEDFNFIDYNALTIQNAEIYMFDRVSQKMRKLVVETDQNTKVIKQYEYQYKGLKDEFSYLNIKSNATKKLEADFKYKSDIKNSHYEINRANKTLKSLLERVKDLQGEVQELECKKQILERDDPNRSEINIEAKEDNDKWKDGYAQGFEFGKAAAYYKGYTEGQNIGHQLGFQDGIKEGWNFGFDDGYKNGVRKIFKDCRDAGINIDSLNMLDYISKEDQLHGLKKQCFDRIFKVLSKNEKLQSIYQVHEKFLQYNDKRRKKYAKMGRKNIIKLIQQLYQQMNSQNFGQSVGLLEFMYDEYSKKYGNSKLAEKKILQILGSTYYHIDSHSKVQFFGMCLHMGRRGYSNEILYFYLSTMDKIQSSNVGIKMKHDDRSDIDIIPYLKALDGVKVVFEEKIPIEGFERIKQDVEKFTITKERVKVVDLDKLLELIVLNYLKYSYILNTNFDSVFHSFTLYENYYMTYNEFMMLMEYLEPAKIKVDASGLEIELKDFQKIFSKKYNDLGEDLFKGQKWRNLKYLDSLEIWQARINRIDKSISVIHDQQLILAAYIYQECLLMYLNKKQELYGDAKEDEDDICLLDMETNVNNQQEANENAHFLSTNMITSGLTMKKENFKKPPIKHPNTVSPPIGSNALNTSSESAQVIPSKEEILSAVQKQISVNMNANTNPQKKLTIKKKTSKHHI